MEAKFFELKKIFFCSFTLLIAAQLIQCHPFIRYDGYDDGPDGDYEMDIMSKLSEVPPVRREMTISQPSLGHWARDKKARGGLTAGDIAAYLMALQKDRNAQTNGDRIKNQRFGISK